MLNVQCSIRRVILVVIVFLVSNWGIGQEIKKIKITDLQKTIIEAKTPLIVNFWATWCKPCIEEIPYFEKELKEHARDSIQLILVSLDFQEEYPAGIKTFVKKRKFSSSVQWLDETNADYFCPKVDPKWSGAIPASLFINNMKGYRKFYEEQLSSEQLKKEIKSLLGLPHN